jgi:hypothetical protein
MDAMAVMAVTGATARLAPVATAYAVTGLHVLAATVGGAGTGAEWHAMAATEHAQAATVHRVLVYRRAREFPSFAMRCLRPPRPRRRATGSNDRYSCAGNTHIHPLSIS